MSVLEVKNVGKYQVELHSDEGSGIAPFDYDMIDTWGIDLSGHRDYKSPTYGAELPVPIEHLFTDPDDLDQDERDDVSKFLKEYHVLDVYMYDHSGRTISTTAFHCPWDSGRVGVVYISRNKAEAQGLKDPEEYLRYTVKELDCFMRGELYGWTVVDDRNEVLESCWGYVGDPEYVMSEGVSVAEAFLTPTGWS